jgi:hypothetical protein
MPTKDELERENATLREENARLRAGQAVGRRPAPTMPSFEMSAGTAADIEQAEQRVRAGDAKEIPVVEPFTGSVVTTVTADNVDAEEDDADEYDETDYQ